MRKVIKIGFPILCVAVIGGTFILLNRTTDRINRIKLVEEDEESVSQNVVANEIEEEEVTTEKVVVSSEEVKAQEIKNKAKAIEIVKKLAPPTSNIYYTNEGMADGKYLVAIRDNDTKDVKIYYATDIEKEEIEVYVK